LRLRFRHFPGAASVWLGLLTHARASFEKFPAKALLCKVT